MSTALAVMAEELAEVTQWDDAPPPKLEEQELDLLAFELWHRTMCPDFENDEDCLGEEEALRGHASCL